MWGCNDAVGSVIFNAAKTAARAGTSAGKSRMVIRTRRDDADEGWLPSGRRQPQSSRRTPPFVTYSCTIRESNPVDLRLGIGIAQFHRLAGKMTSALPVRHHGT